MIAVIASCAGRRAARRAPARSASAGASGGAEVIRRAGTAVPATRFLALSVSDRAEDVVGVIRAGARGYITKGSSAPR